MRWSPCAEPGAADVIPWPTMIEHGEPGRRELDDAKLVTRGEVGVEPPPEAPVELLRAIDIRNRDDDDLEFHVDRSHTAHVGLLVAPCGAPSEPAWPDWADSILRADWVERSSSGRQLSAARLSAPAKHAVDHGTAIRTQRSSIRCGRTLDSDDHDIVLAECERTAQLRVREPSGLHGDVWHGVSHLPTANRLEPGHGGEGRVLAGDTSVTQRSRLR